MATKLKLKKCPTCSGPVTHRASFGEGVYHCSACEQVVQLEAPVPRCGYSPSLWRNACAVEVEKSGDLCPEHEPIAIARAEAEKSAKIRDEQREAKRATGGSCPICGSIVNVRVVRPEGKRKGWRVGCETCLSRPAEVRDPAPVLEIDPQGVYESLGFASEAHGVWPIGARAKGDHPAVVGNPQAWKPTL